MDVEMKIKEKMEINKTKTLIILAILLIVLTLQNVSSIGITPGRTTINFEPGLHREVSFSIIKSFTYTVDLPQKLSEPGLHEIEIVALEMPKDIKEKGALVGATVAVATQLHVYVPYPNKYLEAELNVVESGEDGKGSNSGSSGRLPPFGRAHSEKCGKQEAQGAQGGED